MDGDMSSQLIQRCTTLRHLNISCNNLTVADLRLILSALDSPASNLLHLSAAGNPFGAAAADLICSALHKTTLVALDVAWSQLGDRGRRSVEEAGSVAGVNVDASFQDIQHAPQLTRALKRKAD
eukprot:CAMPEP_0175826458 /NCGR_PEP_ID=MMETSP0107_2-20121207/11777_1 /TAXON_ID=195067 ORGANISM="Goniomonas pacifica, Strain CCMP1869" /NCGR_SAMPLE_ID=MMETSP0107_2 /ASSEMBLY_ACC=CAM_ASM_000203 /LENGTH=123 /DNA_ID=CAMNT_0017139101 /DNA_START=117 /DNA_END=488 /DNA_ORIENTATION=+